VTRAVLIPSASLPASTRARSRGFPYRAVSWLTPVAVLALWELLARLGVLPRQVLPAPSSVLAKAGDLLADGELVTNLLASLQRSATGFAIGASLGLARGLRVGLSRVAEALLDRSIQMVRAVPFLAILPLVIVWFGIGEAGKIFLISLGTAVPLYLTTVLGIRQIDPKLLEMTDVVGLGRTAQIRWVVLPGALPSILGGLRLSLTAAWLALVIAETLGADAGLGFMATNAREFLQTDVIVLVVLIYAVIGILCDLVTRLLERRLLRWHPTYARLTA
jgi:sulfonate transport system permease protein